MHQPGRSPACPLTVGEVMRVVLHYSDRVPEEMARPLPYRDMQALFDVTLIFHSRLLNGEAPPEMVTRTVRRMTEDGLLPEGASAGELAATVGDLIQKLHYPMGSGDVLPEPSPRETWHSLYAPTVQVAEACRDALIDVGSPAVLVREINPATWEALAAFPDLPPDYRRLCRPRLSATAIPSATRPTTTPARTATSKGSTPGNRSAAKLPATAAITPTIAGRSINLDRLDRSDSIEEC